MCPEVLVTGDSRQAQQDKCLSLAVEGFMQWLQPAAEGAAQRSSEPSGQTDGQTQIDGNAMPFI